MFIKIDQVRHHSLYTFILSILAIQLLHCLNLFEFTLHEQRHFPGPGISWKTQKQQVNITFTSTFCLKKDRIFLPRYLVGVFRAHLSKIRKGLMTCHSIAGLVFLLLFCWMENLIIQWVSQNVLTEICHVFNIYYSSIGTS